MDFNNWSWIGRKRFVAGIAAVVGALVGFGMGFFEDSFPEYSVLGTMLILSVVAGVFGYRNYKRMKRRGMFDERHMQISYNALEIAWSVLMVFLVVVAAIPTFSDLDIPVVLLVWVAIVGNIVVLELAKEYYRRQM